MHAADMAPFEPMPTNAVSKRNGFAAPARAQRGLRVAPRADFGATVPFAELRPAPHSLPRDGAPAAAGAEGGLIVVRGFASLRASERAVMDRVANDAERYQ